MTFKTMDYFKPFVEVDERCGVHDCQMVLVQATGKAICRFCTQEAIEAKGAKLAQEAYEKSRDFKRDYYLYTFPEVNEELREASFQSFMPKTSDEKRVKSEAIRITGAYIKGANNNTLLFGGSGAGKSHLAYAMIKNYARRTGKVATIVNFPDLLSRIKDDFNKTDKGRDKNKAYLAVLIDVDLLVLDDLGAERQSEWTDEVLYMLLDKRSRTIITTNLTSSELQKRYDKRTVSRISKGVSKEFIVNFEGVKDKRGGLFDV